MMAPCTSLSIDENHGLTLWIQVFNLHMDQNWALSLLEWQLPGFVAFRPSPQEHSCVISKLLTSPLHYALIIIMSTLCYCVLLYLYYSVLIYWIFNKYINYRVLMLLQVISVATGTKCINGEHLSLKGQCINDCHAEVVARRCLVHFLFSQLEKLADTTENGSDFSLH